MDIFKIVSSPVHVIYRLHSNPTKKVEIIDAHRRGEGEGKYSTPPLANFKTLVNKNAIKPEIGGPPPWQFFLKALTQNSSTTSPGFSTRVYLWLKFVSNEKKMEEDEPQNYLDLETTSRSLNHQKFQLFVDFFSLCR